MKGRLNLFQATMLRWRGLHPYNAVHVVLIEMPLDEARLVAAIDAQLTAAGLTGLVVDRRGHRYEYRGGPAKFAFAVSADDGDAQRALSRELERQLNLPFPPDGPLEPFRFFALRAEGGFRLGLAYDHFIAGGDSIVSLLQDIVERYAGTFAPASAPELYPPTFAALFARNGGAFVRGLVALPRLIASCRHGVRPRYANAADHYNQFTHVPLDPAATAALLAKAKAWGVTFNDVLLAMLLFVLSPLAAERRQARKRRELAVGSVVNLRSEFALDTRATFGQFLSSMRVSHPVPEGVGVEQLARDIHRQTQRFKARRLYLQTLLAVCYSGLTWRFLDRSRREGFYAKTFPLCAGLTTLNVNAIWRADGGPVPRDYLRAVPTGPLAPLVVAATTSGNIVHLGLSYRRAAFSAEKIDRIAAELVQCIRSTA